MNTIDMTNSIIGNWKVIRLDDTKTGKGAYWICECQCGEKITKSISGVNLRLKRMPKSCSDNCSLKETKKHKSNIFDLSGEFGIGFTEKNEIFYFDLDDYDKICNFYWHMNNKKYIKTRRMEKDISMHRLVMNAKENESVDHINHIPYDNRKSNLRIVTHHQNMLNKVKYSNNTSGYKGVSWHKRDEKWVVRIQINKKEKEVGRFNNLEDAVEARVKAEIDYYGEYRLQM